MTNRKIQWSEHSYSFNKAKRGMFSKTNLDTSQYEELETTQEEMAIIDGYCIETPLGVFFVDDELNPYKNFEFWIGHTNFDISPAVKDIIIETPGVEVFQVITRYRFLIGIGKLFAFQDVRASLQQQLCGTSIDVNALAARINSLQQTMTERKCPEWTIYLFPNGELEFSYLEPDESNLEEYNIKKAQLIEASTISKGKLYLNERENSEPSTPEA